MKKTKSIPGKIWRVIAGYELAVICMVLLLVIVFFSTLEQAEEGLYIVSKRYYDITAYFVQPKLNGKLVPLLLPGAYWVCALFTVNLICGGIVRMIKTFFRGNPDQETLMNRFFKGLGILVSHGSMAMLMISGAITYHMKESNLLTVTEEDTNNVAFSPENIAIEVREITDNMVSKSYVIKNEKIKDLIIHEKDEAKPIFWKKAELRRFRIEGMPFTLELKGWHRNARIFEADKADRKEGDGPIVNKVFLRGVKAYTDTEMMQKNVGNLAACYLDVIPDDKAEEAQTVVLWQHLRTPVSVTVGDKVYGFKMDSEKTVLPFAIKLDDLVIDKYQGSNRDKSYQSYVTYKNGADERSFFIEMNEPMRYQGYTLFQTSVGQYNNKKWYSVYEVVKNPSDQWPKWSIIVCGIALLAHFLYKLIIFIMNSSKGGRRGQ